MLKVLLFAMPDHILGFDMVAQAPNLAIVSLAGNVDPGICDVKVADLLLIRRRMDEYVLGLLREHSPALVGLAAKEDFDRNGQVDILDAFALARRIKASDEYKGEWDINRDGLVNQKDVDMIAMAAVSLKRRTFQ